MSTARKLVLGHCNMGTGRVEPFDSIYTGKDEVVTGESIRNGAEIDALVIWGGEDISTSLYKEKASKFTYSGPSLSHRDKVESEACQAAIDRNIPIIGVCRGAQLVCAMAGGRLIQHVTGHGGSHAMDTFDGMKIITTSVHHQMMYPFDIDHKMIAWSSERQSNIYINDTGLNDERMNNKMEPEIVWFPKIRALAIQGHPEFVMNPDDSPFVQYCLDLVDEFILEKEVSE